MESKSLPGVSAAAPPPGSPRPAQPSPTGLPWISRTWHFARSSAYRYRLSVPVQVCASSHRKLATLACLGCQRAKVHRHVQVPLQHIPVPPRRFSHIHVDLVGSLPASKGFTYLFTIIDRTSHWPEAIPIAATSTVDCANALFQGWVSRFGVLAVITSDRGTKFTSSLWAPSAAC
jgi:hypothetical protein